MLDRNQNSHFSKNPEVDIPRSRFSRPMSVKLSFNAGSLIPFYVDEVLPGDTFDITTSKLVRMQTLLTPCMDDIYFDTFYFFIPYRLVWQHWKEFNGENTSAPWTQTVDYTIPQIECPEDGAALSGWPVGSIADYMGVPVSVTGDYSVSALPFRAYALVWNEWFRDQNLQTPQNVSLGDASVRPNAMTVNALDVAQYGFSPLPVGKFRDYFTSCLPSPQKGPDVLLPLGTLAPVYSLQNSHDTEPSSGVGVQDYMKYTTSTGMESGSFYNALVRGSDGAAVTGDTVTLSSPFKTMYPNNLWTDLTQATAATINQLRLAFQIQKIYEKDARGGTRYIEILAHHFGVTSPDSRLQRPEYLGGNRMLVNVNQVVQNSESATTPQGTTTAYSLTLDTHEDFRQSFVEHGLVLGLCCVRYKHTYQQGLERFWSRKNRFDFYWPSLANIGEQPVYNREIYLTGSPSDSEVFGYQEAWADYRYKPSRVSGEMRSDATASLDVWHLADDYSQLPALSDSWIQEDKTNIDRVLAVQSSVSNQFFADIYVDNKTTRPMPLFSIPGLIDHH